MQFTNVTISSEAAHFISNLSLRKCGYDVVNQSISSASGIADFFSCQEEFNELAVFIADDLEHISEPDRKEYGDFQTNLVLRSANTI